jgi:CheY-like chemotaxis protein
VDDNRDSAESLALILQLVGHEVRSATDGFEGLEAARVFRPEVVFLDIGMPRMDGYDLARRIREQHWDRRPALIALTGWGQERDWRWTREAGFDHHLVKPVDIEAVLEVLGDPALSGHDHGH